MSFKRIGPKKWEFQNHDVIELTEELIEHSLNNVKFSPERDSRGWLIKLKNIPIENIIQYIAENDCESGPILLKSANYNIFWNAIQKLSITSANTR